MITKILLLILSVSFAHAASIPDSITKELWYLKNTGAPYRLLGHDLRWQDLRGKVGADVGIPKQAIHLKKKVRVAVIDSGIHMNHAYLGDFVHWDQLEAYQSTIAIRPAGAAFSMTDEEGHGTHIAGVMASLFRSLPLIDGNKAEDYFEIIPFKVFNYSNDKEFLQNQVYENFKKAIRQALDLKVDVILTSTSWPKLKGSEELDRLLAEAARAGIIFVGASGNKLSRNIMFPCDSQYVFCVGASNQQGQFAEQFSEVSLGGSNYGLAVDALAPGVQILSSFVQGMDVQPKIFLDSNSPLYSLDGTSHSAPLVAALATVLKSVFPEEKRETILSRMYLGSDLEYKHSFFDGYTAALFGPVSLQNSLSVKPLSLVLPQFKGRLEFTIEGPEVQVPIWLKCLNGPCGKVDYQILVNQRGQNRKVQFENSMAFANQNEVDLKFPYTMDLNGSAEVDVEIHIRTSQFQRAFRTTLMAQKSADQLQVIPQPFASFKKLRNPVEIRGNSKLQFVSMDDVDDKTKSISLVDFESRSVKSFAVKGLSKIRFAFQRDFNGDGQDDLAVVYAIVDENEKEDAKKEKEYISYFDFNLLTLAGLPASFFVELPGGLWPFESALFKWRWSEYEGNKLLVPVIFGILPQTSRSSQPVLHPKSFTDSLSFSSQKKQILTFIPSAEKVFKMKTLTDYDFYKSFYDKFKLNPNDEISLIEVMRADPDNHQYLVVIKERENVSTILIEASQNYTQWTASKSPFQSPLSTRLRSQFWRPEVAEKDRTFIIQEYNKYQQLVLFQQKGQTFEFSITDSEPVKYFLDAVLVQSGLVVIAATDFEIKSWLVRKDSSQARVVSRLRYDFMNVHENNQQMLTHNFVRPLSNGAREVVVQNAYWNGNRLSSLQVNELGQLYYSLNSSYALPTGCLITKEGSQRLRRDRNFGLAFCFAQPNQFSLVQTKN